MSDPRNTKVVFRLLDRSEKDIRINHIHLGGKCLQAKMLNEDMLL